MSSLSSLTFQRLLVVMRSPWLFIASLLALATRSSATCIPSAIQALTQNLKASVSGTELVMPLGVTMFRFGPAFYYAICTMFIAQMYSRDLALVDYAFIVFASVLASLASAGTTGILTISLVSLVCVPLRLPFEAALVLFIAADTFVDPFRTLAIVYGNCAASVCVTGKESQTDLTTTDQKLGA
jgi:proton glutamate symport protein